MSKYVIIDAESIQKRIEELEKEEVSEFSPGRRLWVNSAIKNLKEVLCHSTSLIPKNINLEQYYEQTYRGNKQECQFEIDNSKSSATKCKFCGKEKWQH